MQTITKQGIAKYEFLQTNPQQPEWIYFVTLYQAKETIGYKWTCFLSLPLLLILFIHMFIMYISVFGNDSLPPYCHYQRNIHF